MRRRHIGPILVDTMTTRILLLLLGSSSLCAAWTYDTPYEMPSSSLVGEAGRSDTAWYFDTLASSGTYPRTGTPVHEGGWSGIEIDPSDSTGSSFWTVSEGGLVVSRETTKRNDRIVAFPGYHQKIAHVVLSGGALRIDQLDSVATWGNPAVFTNGLQNALSSSDATQLRMNLATGAIDTTATLAPSNDGYDFEAIRYHDGWFWIADESGPYILKVSKSTHRIEEQWYPDNGLPKVYLRRRANRGFEAMAVTPSGLVAALVQSPMLNAQGSVDNSTTRDSRVMRLLLLNPGSGTVQEFVYLNDQKPNSMGATRKGRDCKVGDMVAIGDSRFLVVEHGADAAGKYWIDLWMVDVSGATNVTATNKIGATFSSGTLTLEQLSDSATLRANGVVPATKTLVRADISGTTPWVSTQPEGIGIVDDTTVVLLSDDNYGCREMDADGGPDGICHSPRVGAARSTLMYIKAPPLGWSRVSARRAARPSETRVSAVRAGISVSWPAGSGTVSIELAGPDGRAISRWSAATSTAGTRVLPTGNAGGLFVVRVRASGIEKTRIVALP